MRKHIVILLSLVAAAGCSSGPGARSGTDADAPSPRVAALDAGSVSTPLDSYAPPPGLTLTLRRAEVILTNQCLERFGYTEHPMPTPEETSSTRKHSEFLVFSIAQASELGYNSPKGTTAASDSDWDRKSSRVQRGLLDGTLRKYKGESVPKGGCVGVAADGLTKNSRVPKRLEGGGVQLRQLQKASPTSLGDAEVGIIRLDAISATRRDHRYIELIRSWSSCMRQKGYEYESPERALDDGRWNGSVPSESEKKTAVADMTCKKAVNYLEVASEVQSTYEKKVIGKRIGELAQLRRNLKAWKMNADKAIKDAV